MDTDFTDFLFVLIVTSQYFGAVAGVSPRHTGRGQETGPSPQVFEKILLIYVYL
jgi:hypothetical protein